jgi:poly(3-hydroxybutyrate) depolymerase
MVYQGRLRLWVIMGSLSFMAVGCEGCEPEIDTCEYALNGTCDEPAHCNLGSDTTDCDEACEQGEDTYLFAAACHDRQGELGARFTDSAPSTGSSTQTGSVDGYLMIPSGCNSGTPVPRHYRLYVPSNLESDVPAPVVVVMPGHRVSHFDLEDYTHLARTAEQNGFIVVFAEQEWRDLWGHCSGLASQNEFKWAWWTDWDWTNRSDDNPDLIFLEQLVTEIGTMYNIDQRRVMAVGHSRGGAMSVIAALELPHVFCGAVPQAGFTEFGYDVRMRAYEGRVVPMYIIHGAADPDVSVMASDNIVSILEGLGWSDEDLHYERIDGVKHRWQPQLNQHWYEFLAARPLPEEVLP